MYLVGKLIFTISLKHGKGTYFMIYRQKLHTEKACEKTHFELKGVKQNADSNF